MFRKPPIRVAHTPSQTPSNDTPSEIGKNQSHDRTRGCARSGCRAVPAKKMIFSVSPLCNRHFIACGPQETWRVRAVEYDAHTASTASWRSERPPEASTKMGTNTSRVTLGEAVGGGGAPSTPVQRLQGKNSHGYPGEHTKRGHADNPTTCPQPTAMRKCADKGHAFTEAPFVFCAPEIQSPTLPQPRRASQDLVGRGVRMRTVAAAAAMLPSQCHARGCRVRKASMYHITCYCATLLLQKSGWSSRICEVSRKQFHLTQHREERLLLRNAQSVPPLRSQLQRAHVWDTA